jgi:hypothetical protein
MDTFEKVAIALLAFLLALICSVICWDIAERNVREQAVLRGYAQWKVDDRGQKVTFEWKK